MRDDLRFTGRRLDSETGLQLNRNRFFHSKLGRWVNRDPIGYSNSMNLFEYVLGRPTYFVDSTGLIGVFDDGSQIGGDWGDLIDFGKDQFKDKVWKPFEDKAKDKAKEWWEEFDPDNDDNNNGPISCPPNPWDHKWKLDFKYKGRDDWQFGIGIEFTV